MPEPFYRGRFAPSPTGPLHAGSLVAAMASYLDAKAHCGQWLVRIEDVDETRTIPGAAEQILQCLAGLGMQWDGEAVWQSRRKALYQAAFERLTTRTYPCGCTRREIADSRLGIGPDGAAIYPGTCRTGLPAGKSPRAFRLRIPAPTEADEYITFEDRRLGPVAQHLSSETGDFLLKRADGLWAYQLTVVADDADQGVTHVVRGADLLDSTARQIYLQRLLKVRTPRYMHVPVVLNALGEKLSKQTGARPLDLAQPLNVLMEAARFLDLPIQHAESVKDLWQQAVALWADRFSIARQKQ